jgi:urea transport system ATP-binding protein
MLAIEGLSQAYGGSVILRDVSLTVQPGKVTVLLGRNGVGKSTLLRTVMGLHPARAGNVSLNGEKLNSLTPFQRARRGVGLVPQGREIFPRLSVLENLRTGLAAERIKDVPAQVFTLFPVLKEMQNRRGGDLSGGQQQQLAIARALCGQPQVLMLDEPTEGIQPSVIKDIGRTIAALAKEHKLAVLLVEQYYAFARDLADDYYVMERGEITAHGAGADMEKDGVQRMISV